MTADMAIRGAIVADPVVRCDRFCGSFGAHLTTADAGAVQAVIPAVAQDVTVDAQAAAVAAPWPFPAQFPLKHAIVVVPTPIPACTRQACQPKWHQVVRRRQ